MVRVCSAGSVHAECAKDAHGNFTQLASGETLALDRTRRECVAVLPHLAGMRGIRHPGIRPLSHQCGRFQIFPRPV
jgi:hypothetical protein